MASKKTTSRSKKTSTSKPSTTAAPKAAASKAKHCKNCSCEQIPGATFCHHCNVPQ